MSSIFGHCLILFRHRCWNSFTYALQFQTLPFLSDQNYNLFFGPEFWNLANFFLPSLISNPVDMQIVLQHIVQELGGTLSFPSSSSSSSPSWSKRLSKHSSKDKFPQDHDAKPRSTTNQNQSLVLFPEEYPIPQSLWVSLGFPFSQSGNPWFLYTSNKFQHHVSTGAMQWNLNL